MTAFAINPPFPIFANIDGDPLDGGKIYVGVANLDPVTNPVALYWDAGLTIPATQPIVTSGGYAVRNGTPAIFYADAVSVSITLKDAVGVTVFTAAQVDSLGVPGEASLIGFIRGLPGAVASTVQTVLRNFAPTPYDFGAIGDGLADDSVAMQAWLSIGGALRLAAGNFRITEPLIYTQNAATDWRDGEPTISIVGDGANCTFITYDGPTSDTVLRVNGVFPVANSFRCVGFTMKRADGSPASVGAGIGLHVRNMLSFEITDMKIFRHGVGLYMEGCLVGTVRDNTIIYNDIGAWAEIGTTWTSTPNILDFSSINFAANYTRGLKIIGGTGVIVENCAFDGVGSTDSNGIGIEAVNMGTAGGVGLLVNNGYFENIGGTAIYITHGNLSCTYVVNSCTFNRFGGTTRKMKGVVFDPSGLGPGAAPALLDLRGSAWNAYAGWTYDAAALAVELGAGAGYDGLTVLDDGARFQLATEVPVYPVIVNRTQIITASTYFNGTTAALTSPFNISGAVRNSAGDYTFAFQRGIAAINGVTFTADNTNCVAKVTATTTTTIRVVTHIAGVATDTNGWLTVVGR